MLFNKNKNLYNLRKVWGKQTDKKRDLNLISSYHRLLANKNPDDFVDKKTWEDLNFDSIFSKLDRNLTGIGQQYLYHLLHRYESNESLLKKRYELYVAFKDNSDLREKIQLELLKIDENSSLYIAQLLLDKNLPNFKYYSLFYLFAFASILSLFLIQFNGIFLFITIGILLINLIIHKINSSKIYSYFTGFSSLNSLLKAAINISQIKNAGSIDEIQNLIEKKIIIKSLKKKLGYLVIDKQYQNELMIALIEYLNMFLLFDIIAYYRSVNVLLKNQNEIHDVMKSVAALDYAISIASFLTEMKSHSTPLFTDSAKISFEKLYHPLIEDAVTNSLQNISQSVLITGSNMAGKTTFIKTIGINFIMAQTLYFVFANEFTIPKYVVKTSIRRNDELEEGKSYFFVEIETLKKFIDLSQGKKKYLYLIDEIFRGTNTVERLASSTAVLKYLAASHKVFVTTHDIELQDLLCSTFKMFHFSEQVEDGKYFFDYRLQHGVCSSGNAIKLLEIMNYPQSITNEAKQIVKKIK